MHEDGNRRGVTQRIRHGGRGWELRETSRASAGYAPHVHDTFSLGQILGGRSRCLIGGRTRRIAAGACMWVRTGEVHACNPRPGAPWSYRMLHIDPAWLRAQGVSEPHSGVSASRALWLDYEALARRIFEDAPHAETEAGMLRLVRRLAPESDRTDRPGRAEPDDPAALRRVREYIEAHACETLALDELAVLAGTPPWRLLRDFQRHHGITPHALQLCLRANRARRWLREGMTPCDAALAAGFADQSHLTRMFKRYAALTPGAYRRALTA